MKDYIKSAMELGFTKAAYFNPQDLSFDDAEVLREACKANDCGMYGKFWTCPPGVGTPKTCEEEIMKYHHGIVLQLLTEAINYAIQPEMFSEICVSFNSMAKTLRKGMEEDGLKTFLLGMSGCTYCKKCTYPHKPCQFIDKMVPCISGHCINVYRLWDSTGNRRADLSESDFYSIILWNEPE